MIDLNKRKEDRIYYYLYCDMINGEEIQLGRYCSLNRCKEVLNEIIVDFRNTCIYDMPNK